MRLQKSISISAIFSKVSKHCGNEFDLYELWMSILVILLTLQWLNVYEIFHG